MPHSRAAQLVRNVADIVESSPIDLDTLCRGPLGEALTRREIAEVADDPAAVNELVEGLRLMANRMETTLSA